MIQKQTVGPENMYTSHSMWTEQVAVYVFRNTMYVCVYIHTHTYAIEEKEAINLKSSREEKEGSYDIIM